MLSELYITNFKSINMSAPIEIKPCTILCGSNSSGKSSLIQAILLLSQSFSSGYSGESVNLNGYLTRLGSFSDIKSHNINQDEISISFILNLPHKFNLLSRGHEQKIHCELTLGKRKIDKYKNEDEHHPILIRAKYELFSKNSKQEDTLQCIEINLPDNLSRNELNYEVCFLSTTEAANIESEFPDYEITGLREFSLVPSTFHIKYNYTKKISEHIISKLTPSKNNYNIDTDTGIDQILLPRSLFNEIDRLIELELSDLLDNFENIVKERENALNS